MRNFILSLCLAIPSLLFSRTEISFIPLQPICSTDTLSCSQLIDYPFTLNAANPGDLTISHQLSINGNAPGADTYGQVSGVYPDYYISGTYPIGNYTIQLAVDDGMGNVMTAEMPFEVVDCVAPILECVQGIAVEMLPFETQEDIDGDGDIEDIGVVVYAEDLVNTTLSYCGDDSIRYSINRKGDLVDINESFILIECCTDPATLIVEIYAWDSVFNPYAIQPDGSLGGPNYDFCEAYVLVQDNAFNLCDCFGNGSVSGVISTEENNPVGGVVVSLSGNQNDHIVTEEDGAYGFFNLELFYDYTITPFKDDSPLNGLSAFDIVLLRKHILGIISLDSPYKMIAADTNGSGSVTTVDIIMMYKVILAIETAFPNVPTWRFVDADFDFPDPDNPWLTSFSEAIHLNDLNSYMSDHDFIAIKVGDLNASVVLDD